MRTLLRVVGIFELIGYFIGIIVLAVNIVFGWPTVLYFIFYIVFAPTIGILCISVANLLDSRDELTTRIEKLESQLNSKVERTKTAVEMVNEKKKEEPTKITSFEIGDEVVILIDYQTNNGTIVKSGTAGVVISTNETSVRVKFDIDGEIVTVFTSNVNFALKKWFANK